jgi:hypothetical protein
MSHVFRAVYQDHRGLSDGAQHVPDPRFGRRVDPMGYRLERGHCWRSEYEP